MSINKKLTRTEEGLFMRIGGARPKPRPHSHKWYVNNGETNCIVCGKRHPSERGNK